MWSPGRILIIFGIVLILIGVLMSIPGLSRYIGRLPGDIHITRRNFSFHFPLVTCILLSILISIIIRIFFRK